MYIIAIISSLPKIIKNPNTIIVAGSVSESITPADNPPVVIIPAASKNASWNGTFSISARCAPVIADIVGNNAMMIKVDMSSFLFCACNSHLRILDKNALMSLRWNNLKIFKPPAVENPHPPINISMIRIV